jgi:DNA-directed RNA polymerase subunit beta'
MVAGALPEAMRGQYLGKKDPLNASDQEELMTRIAKEHKNEYGQSINKLKDLGNMWATQTAFSIGLSELTPDREARNRILTKADAQVSKLSGPSKDAKTVEIYTKATDELDAHFKAVPEEGNNLMLLHNMGMKGGTNTIRQIRAAPMLMANHKGEIIPNPVRKSYAEGLDIAGYWTATSGGRKGVIQKVQAVQEPGHITKQVLNSTMNNLIIDHDCGTDKGISLPIDEKDILDRFTAADVKLGNRTVKAGALITPELKSAFRNNNVGKVVVRSPLRCLHGPGLCQKCFGYTEDGRLPDIGLNVGILAGQAIGERATQLAMKAFHQGGTASSKSALVDQFEQVQDLLWFPKTLPGSATLSTLSGKVTKIEKDPAGGHNVFVEGERHYVPQNRGVPIYDKKHLVVGTEVKKGLPISEGRVNPQEMLPLTGIEPVQALLASNLNDMYKDQGIRRRNHEVVIKALTNLTRIKDAGSSTHFIRGDFAPTTFVSSLNRKMAKGEHPIVHEPLLKGVNVLPLDMQEDWMAKLNHEGLAETVINAAQQGWRSNIHGLHPIPAVVYAAELGKPPKEHPEWY